MEESCMKKIYEKPEIEIVEFDSEDTICNASIMDYGADWLIF
jgi:hypothetical protein